MPEGMVRLPCVCVAGYSGRGGLRQPDFERECKPPRGERLFGFGDALRAALDPTSSGHGPGERSESVGVGGAPPARPAGLHPVRLCRSRAKPDCAPCAPCGGYRISLARWPACNHDERVITMCGAGELRGVNTRMGWP
jgi:hypothetical protein